MSKFAAIEARATQYPADPNDVVWLVGCVRRLRDALIAANRELELIERDMYAAPEYPDHLAVIRDALASLDEPNLP